MIGTLIGTRVEKPTPAEDASPTARRRSDAEPCRLADTLTNVLTWLTPVALTALLLQLAPDADARDTGIEDLDRIAAAALAAAEGLAPQLPGRRELAVARIDPRLRVARCGAPLQAQSAHEVVGSTQHTIRVLCPASDAGPGWTLFVPVQARYHLRVVGTITPLARGQVVREADLTYLDVTASRAETGLVLDTALAVGRQARRPIPAGSTLRQDMIEAIDVIKRGDRVVLDAGDASFRVRMQGESLQSAAAGERVRVRNSSSRRVVEGIARADGTVHIDR